MPKSSPAICSQPGCGILTSTGRCDAHSRSVTRDYRAEGIHRGSAASRGYDWAWTKLSKRYRRAHPLCEMYCKDEDRLKQAELVDHIIPVDVRPELRLVESNLQSGCNSCNSRKRFEDEEKYRDVRRHREGKGGV